LEIGAGKARVQGQRREVGAGKERELSTEASSGRAEDTGTRKMGFASRTRRQAGRWDFIPWPLEP
jgi:hypothetical protein